MSGGHGGVLFPGKQGRPVLRIKRAGAGSLDPPGPASGDHRHPGPWQPPKGAGPGEPVLSRKGERVISCKGENQGRGRDIRGPARAGPLSLPARASPGQNPEPPPRRVRDREKRQTLPGRETSPPGRVKRTTAGPSWARGGRRQKRRETRLLVQLHMMYTKPPYGNQRCALWHHYMNRGGGVEPGKRKIFSCRKFQGFL